MSEISYSYQGLTCKPLDTYEEILEFLENPPLWKTLCMELKPHSKEAIRNMDINKDFGKTFLETPQTFCHFKPDAEHIIERQNVKKLPKTLLCHDLANGYHDDCVIDGTSNYEAYTFYNWGGIDIFCYFSHHLVTIPPLGWINVGHAHGVKVIGTLITEWSDGVAFWDNILVSEDKMRDFASALVSIAKTLSFDGWLLNVENKILKPKELVEFVSMLHSLLHQELTDPVLLWYDSVTVDGHLNWQNCLNDKNKAFFDACDGIFTNYSWTEGDVRASAAAAGDRLTDLYVGLDVWGRNFYGGGQFNTQEAVKMAHSHGCSLAIFAPAWTHEARADDSCDVDMFTSESEARPYDQFLLRERALWGSLWPYLNTKLPSELPFATSFCRGQGSQRRFYGEVISPGPWYNLRHMQYQPNSSHGPHGYLLSVLENILNASRHGFLKDKAGIIRVRRSLELSRSELTTKEQQKASLDENEKIIDLNVSEENKINPEETHITPVESHDKDVNQERPPKTSRKVSDVFRNLFKMKASKEADDQQHNDSDTAMEQQGSQSSMIQTSLNFCLGHNTKVRLALAPVPGELECLQPYYNDSFIGGSCLKVNPSDKVDTTHRCIRLFHSDFHFKGTMIACVVTKNSQKAPDQYLNVELHAVSSDAQALKIILFGGYVSKTNTPPSSSLVMYALPVHSLPAFNPIQAYMLLNEPGFYVPVDNKFGWMVRYYVVPVTDIRVLSVNCHTGLAEGSILLGHFGLCRREDEAV